MGSLTEAQQSMIIGTLLGDGSMRKKTNAHLEINHAFSQKALVDWKYDALKHFVATPPTARRGNGQRIAYRFTTRSVPELTPFYDIFYPKGKKIIPKELTLTPLALTVWFMDDGSRSRTSVYLNSQQFTLENQYQLMNSLKQLQIQSTLNRDKKYFRIRIRVASIPLFRKLVAPYLLREFMYKLP